jgi:HK97 family phage prohead protease
LPTRRPDFPELTRSTVDLELKAVDVSQRIIEGHAAATSNDDRNGDVIAPGAFKRSIDAGLNSIAVFVAHEPGIGIGEPLEMREDPVGLFTKTRIYATHQGDDVLEVARDRLSTGKTIGMSIGYRVPAGGASIEEIQDKAGRVIGWRRKISDLELREYSYAAEQIVANPRALVSGVKTEGDMGDQSFDGLALQVHELATKLQGTVGALSDRQAAAAVLGTGSVALELMGDEVKTEIEGVIAELAELVRTPTEEWQDDPEIAAIEAKIMRVRIAGATAAAGSE